MDDVPLECRPDIKEKPDAFLNSDRQEIQEQIRKVSKSSQKDLHMGIGIATGGIVVMGILAVLPLVALVHWMKDKLTGTSA